jgi:alkylation response protein AidB-like acyl-CoA dehydrogenase
MSEYFADLRDIRFVLFELLQIDSLKQYGKYKDFGREEYDAFIVEAYKLAQKVLAPLNAAGDKEGARFENGEVFLPKSYHDAYRKFCEGGWIGACGSPEYGGSGLPTVMGMVFHELFLGSLISLTLTIGLSQGVISLLHDFGSPDLQKKFLPGLYEGKWSGTMCLTEPQAGSDVGANKAQAKKIEGNKYSITGTKNFITGGDHDLTENLIHLVLARTEGAPSGTKGLSIFLVPKYRVKDDGSLGELNDVTCAGIEHKMGIKGSPTCTLNFGDNGKCEGYIIGNELDGIKIMFHMMNEARVMVGVQGMTLGAASYQNSIRYSQERIQGNDLTMMKDPKAPRVPIIKHPDVRRMLMIQKTITEGLRAFMYMTAFYQDLVKVTENEAEKEKYKGFIELFTPICKAYGSYKGSEVADIGIQIYGGYGYCSEYPQEQLVRDARIASIYEGTNGIQALDLVGRKLGMKGGQVLMNFIADFSAFTAKNKTHPTLGKFFLALDQAKNLLGEVSMKFATVGLQDVTYPALYASLYLEMFGHILLTQTLLKAALVADEKLKKIYAEKNAATPADKKKLNSENPEAKFYHGKIMSAQFAANTILPQAKALAEAIKNGDKSPLEVEF